MSLFTTYNHSEEELKYRNKIIEEYLIAQRNLLRIYYKEKPKYLYPNSNNYAVIVEPRSNHKLLEAVCRNVMYFLPDDWNLVIYSYDEQQVQSLLPDIEYLFFKTSKPSLNSIEYSNLLMSSEFWNNIPGDNILIFQTDSYITRRFTEEFINEIKKYPFVGAPYRIQDTRFGFNINILTPNLSEKCSMSGGFSFRNKKAMLHCIENITIDMIKNDRIKNNVSIHLANMDYEDFYFEYALYLLNYSLPNDELCYLFCNQVYYYLKNTYAVHGIFRDYVTEHLIFMLRPPLCDIYDEIEYKINNLKQ
jgi:hypothetical protein